MNKLLIIGICFLFITSCQKYPENEIAELNGVLDSAITENVYNTYVDEFLSIQDSVNVVLEKIEAEKSKIIGRRYNTYQEQLKKLIVEINQFRNSEQNEIYVLEQEFD